MLKFDFLPLGGRFRNVLFHSGSMWFRYDFAERVPLAGFSIGSGVYLVDSRPGDNPNRFLLDGYGHGDAFLRYRKELTGRMALVAQFNLQNILDKGYYESASGIGGVYPGKLFTVIGPLGFEF